MYSSFLLLFPLICCGGFEGFAPRSGKEAEGQEDPENVGRYEKDPEVYYPRWSEGEVEVRINVRKSIPNLSAGKHNLEIRSMSATIAKK